MRDPRLYDVRLVVALGISCDPASGASVYVPAQNGRRSICMSRRSCTDLYDLGGRRGSTNPAAI